MQGTIFELAAQVVVERGQSVLPVRGRDSLDLELLYLALNLFGVDALVYFVHRADEEVRADLLELDVVLAEELDLVVLKTCRNGENEWVVEVVFDGLVEQLLFDLRKFLSKCDVEVLAVEESYEVICLWVLVERLEE